MYFLDGVLINKPQSSQVCSKTEITANSYQDKNSFQNTTAQEKRVHHSIPSFSEAFSHFGRMPSEEIHENQLFQPEIVCNREGKVVTQSGNQTSSVWSYNLEWDDNLWSNDVAGVDDVFYNNE